MQIELNLQNECKHADIYSVIVTHGLLLFSSKFLSGASYHNTRRQQFIVNSWWMVQVLPLSVWQCQVTTDRWGYERLEELSTDLIVLGEGPAASAAHFKPTRFFEICSSIFSKLKWKLSICLCMRRKKKDCIHLSGEVLQPDDSSRYLEQCSSHFDVCHFSIMEIKLLDKWVAGFANVGKKKKRKRTLSI